MPSPGIDRDERISVAGLQRLEHQLRNGARMTDRVLAQWIKRYGDAAREIIHRYGRNPEDREE